MLNMLVEIGCKYNKGGVPKLVYTPQTKNMI